jgi:HlyD family secretion protein
MSRTVLAQSPLGARSPDPEMLAALGADARSKSRRWISRVVLLVVLAAGVGGGVWWWKTRSVDTGPRFVTAEAKRADIQVNITATGTLSGVKTVEVGAEVSGKIIKMNVDFNDHVSKGDVLAVIDPSVPKAAVDQAAAQVSDASAAIRTARATVRETRQNRIRAEEQQKLGLVSQRDLEAARAAAERAEAQLASAEANAVVATANLNAAKTKLDKTVIVAPIDGIVLARLMQQGQTVTAGFQTPVMFKVAEDLKKMQLTAYIDEADIGRAKDGQHATFTVDAYQGRTFAAELISVHNEPKTESNVVSYESLLSVDNSELLLRPGMTATATIVAERHEKTLSVPNAALRFNPPRPAGSALPSRGLFGRGGGPRPERKDGPTKGPHVWVLKDGRPRPVAVTIGVTDGTLTEILTGDIAEGTAVIVDTEDQK